MNSMNLLIIMAGIPAEVAEFLAKVLIYLAQAGAIPWVLAIVGIIILAACISGDDK